MSEIRDWARANGYEVGTRGRLSAEVVDAYERAHKPEPVKPRRPRKPRQRKPKVDPYAEYRVDGPVELDWEISTSMVHNKRQIHSGTELSIKGERGRFRFMRHIKRPNGIEWIDVWGGPKKFECWRSFRPEQIRTVHRINRTDKNVLAERAAAKSAA